MGPLTCGWYFRAVRFSVIVPLYNRPDEIRELLESLTLQSVQDFEVLIVEDGSEEDARDIVLSFSDRLDVQYFWKENERQGFTRNFGFERAKGDWFIVFDSDCIIPPDYFKSVSMYLDLHPEVDVFGGPDAAHPGFTPVQKAISHAMTSPLTTGGIRGGKRTVGAYHPRSFNMGISRKAWEISGGYRITVKGEDIEFSMRLIAHGLNSVLIPDAVVYHKRRTDFKQFRKQVEFFGRARVNIRRFFPGSLKPIHWMPTLFLGYVLSLVPLLCIALFWKRGWGSMGALAPLIPYAVWHLSLGLEALFKTGEWRVALLAPRAARIQLTSYGWGLLSEYMTVVLLGRRDSLMGDVREVPDHPKSNPTS